jgi:plasmid rolling circle replication initiator protein Rep
MIGRPAGRLRINSHEPQAAQIKRLDKGLDHTNRIVLRNKVFKRFRKQRPLAAIQTLDKALHQTLDKALHHKLPANPEES